MPGVEIVELSTVGDFAYDGAMAKQNATAHCGLSPAELKAWRKYLVASRRLFEALDTDLEEHELSLADYEVLAQLSDAPDRTMRMSDLADQALVSRSRLSHRIKVMEKAGWVRREACPSDKRGSFAVLTPKGSKAILTAAPDHIENVRTRFISLLSKEDQRVLAQIFERVTDELKNNPPE